jgi:hypothetical protein
LTVDGIPGVKWFGSEGDYNVLVIDLLGEEGKMRRGEEKMGGEGRGK